MSQTTETRQKRPPKAVPLPPLPPGLNILDVVYKPLRDLIPYVRNARLHTDSQIGKIKASMQRFGWTNPMLVAGNDLLAGHARLRAALALAEAGETIPNNPDPWMGPTLDLSHLTDAERRAVILYDNRLAEEATWDNDLLAQEFLALSADGTLPVEFTGFDASEIATIANGWNPDWEKIAKTEAEMADMLATIRIKCAQGDAETVLERVRAAVEGIAGVKVET